MKTYALRLTDGNGQPVQEWIVTHTRLVSKEEYHQGVPQGIMVLTHSDVADNILEAEVSAAIERD